MGVVCLYDSGLKTAGSINVVLICNAREWLSASCPTALTAMAFPAAPAPDIKEKWFGSNGLSIYAPKNITLQIKIGLEVHKRLVSNLSDNEVNMGAGGLRPPVPLTKLDDLLNSQNVGEWLKWAVGCCPMSVSYTHLTLPTIYSV